MCPCDASSAKIMGMPRRVCSTAYRCILLNASAPSRGLSPLTSVFCVQGSARNTPQQPPSGISSIRLTNSSESSTLLSPVFSYMNQPSGQSSCPTFSFTVIRPSKSKTRSSTEALASLYTIGCSRLNRRAMPLDRAAPLGRVTVVTPSRVTYLTVFFVARSIIRLPFFGLLPCQDMVRVSFESSSFCGMMA